jgi:ubiquinone/menaquinone biosynthesis C-methylase UbiE
LANTCNLSFRDFSVDFVSCSELIEHLLNPDEALKEVARVLHKRGLVLVTTPMKYSINEILGRKNSRHNIEHPNVLTYSQFLSEITDKFHVIFEKAILFIPRFATFLYSNQSLIKCLDRILSRFPPLRDLSWCVIVVAVKKAERHG